MVTIFYQPSLLNPFDALRRQIEAIQKEIIKGYDVYKTERKHPEGQVETPEQIDASSRTKE